MDSDILNLPHAAGGILNSRRAVGANWVHHAAKIRAEIINQTHGICFNLLLSPTGSKPSRQVPKGYNLLQIRKETSCI